HRERARTHVERSQLCRLPTCYRNPINVRLAEFVIGFITMIGGEINSRTVLGPGDVSFGITTARQLLRGHLFVASLRRRNDPDMTGMLEIEIARIVAAIDPARDHAHIAFALRRAWTCTRARAWRRTRPRRCLRDFLRRRAIAKRDHLAVRRPLCSARAARHRSK